MRRDITYRYLKIFGYIIGGLAILLGASSVISLKRIANLMKKEDIKEGRETPFGRISKIDSQSISYQFNFSKGERVCLSAVNDSGQNIHLSFYHEGKLTNTFDCDE